jgi:hypothetical protein
MSKYCVAKVTVGRVKMLVPFTRLFPELGHKETRVVVLLDEGDPVKGRYAFLENYCDKPACDCRRVILCVINEAVPNEILASINFGWENPEYYAKWMGSKEDARVMAGATLDPLLPQSSQAKLFRELFTDVVLRDPAYVERLKRHYAMFKAALPPPSPTPPPRPTWKKQRPKLKPPKRRKRPR